jgi:predicted molibdopterin-dependent oxidoreductase YjgC
LPSAAYLEKDGTFVNCQGRVQRIAPGGRPAFPPLGDSREDWRTLLELAARLGRSFDLQGPREIFKELTKAVTPFDGLIYETIPEQGVDVAKASPL